MRIDSINNKGLVSILVPYNYLIKLIGTLPFMSWCTIKFFSIESMLGLVRECNIIMVPHVWMRWIKVIKSYRTFFVLLHVFFFQKKKVIYILMKWELLITSITKWYKYNMKCMKNVMPLDKKTWHHHYDEQVRLWVDSLDFMQRTLQ